ncbi:hypothetical protein SAMN04490199_4118 [Pseudomonas marginalis]|nr:hypothetical protein SAMN04490199_4118 [Pseudomonas marginalis]
MSHGWPWQGAILVGWPDRYRIDLFDSAAFLTDMAFFNPSRSCHVPPSVPYLPSATVPLMMFFDPRLRGT